MEVVHVQFKDEKEKLIVSEFSCAQDPDVYQFLGSVNADDPRYVAFRAPQTSPEIPNPMEKLKAFLSANPDVAKILG